LLEQPFSEGLTFVLAARLIAAVYSADPAVVAAVVVAAVVDFVEAVFVVVQAVLLEAYLVGTYLPEVDFDCLYSLVVVVAVEEAVAVDLKEKVFASVVAQLVELEGIHFVIVVVAAVTMGTFVDQ
jgi:hypothetical protein